MPEAEPVLMVFAGPNGAGKTTAALSILQHNPDPLLYINADAIAAGLAPLDPDSAQVTAGRLMIQSIRSALDHRRSLAVETTLASRFFLSVIQKARQQGYTTSLLFFWMPSPDTALERVAARVASGGHAIPEDTVIRRWHRGLQNFQAYAQTVHSWSVLDTASWSPRIIAEQTHPNPPLIHQRSLWHKILSSMPPS
jgi:predicted ABC-type ATPase